ncbi:Flp family type IVb pilin [Cupriavidus campinensis]
MNTMFDGIKRFVREEDGAAGVEYALLLAFVALVMVTYGSTVKTAVGNIWSTISSELSKAAP